MRSTPPPHPSPHPARRSLGLPGLLGLLGAACATPGNVRISSGGAGGPWPAPAGTAAGTASGGPELGPPAATYVTSPRSSGGPGARPTETLASPGARALDGDIARALAARGASVVPDQALATMARVLLDRAARSGSIDAEDVERMARHLGFPGGILAACVFPLTTGDESGEEDTWRQSLAEIAPNLAVTRYGLAVSERTETAAVVFGDMSVTLDGPLPRHFPAPGSTRLRGQLGPRFGFGHLYVTGPDGRVTETSIANRRFDLSLTLPVRGVYRVELMGDGAGGPTIVMNVPVSVGVDVDLDGTTGQGGAAGRLDGVGPRPGPPGGARPISTAAFEARMLELLDAARAQAGLKALVADPQLRAVALAHAQDMERAHFFGHVSPTTGSTADRLARAGIEVTTSGENLSQASTPDESHAGLMESPGHRANMLGPRFTHVGIGVARTTETPPRYLTTLLFARRPPAGQAFTAADAVAAIGALRARRGARPAAVDPGLRAAAESGMAAFQRTSVVAEAAAAANAAFVLEAARAAARQPGAAGRSACTHFFEILDPEQLESLPVLVDPRLARMGVAVGARLDAGTPRFAVIVVAEGVPCAGR
jgi:uncharacterized protein YkwD